MEIIITLFAVVILPLIIVAFLPHDKSFFARPVVRGFGLGIYLMLVVVLLMESMEETNLNSSLVYFAVGLLFSFLIGLILKEFHHHHSEGKTEHIHDKASASRVLISDFFHNAVDGTAIIAGFYISPAVGGIAFLGVLGHQILQQVGQHILLVESGVKAKNAIFISFLISLSIFFGFLLEGNAIIGIILAVSAGIVAWKVWSDLVDISWDSQMITGFMAGALILAIILLGIPHAHDREDDGYEEDIINTEDTPL